MQTTAQRIRSLVDRLYKQQALRAPNPTGKDGRVQAEALNTGAAARNQAMMATKKQGVGVRTLSLADLLRKKA